MTKDEIKAYNDYVKSENIWKEVQTIIYSCGPMFIEKSTFGPYYWGFGKHWTNKAKTLIEAMTEAEKAFLKNMAMN